MQGALQPAADVMLTACQVQGTYDRLQQMLDSTLPATVDYACDSLHAHVACKQ